MWIFKYRGRHGKEETILVEAMSAVKALEQALEFLSEKEGSGYDGIDITSPFSMQYVRGISRP